MLGAVLVEVPEPRPPAVTLSVAYPQARFRPARVRAFLNHLQDELMQAGEELLPTGIRHRDSKRDVT